MPINTQNEHMEMLFLCFEMAPKIAALVLCCNTRTKDKVEMTNFFEYKILLVLEFASKNGGHKGKTSIILFAWLA